MRDGSGGGMRGGGGWRFRFVCRTRNQFHFTLDHPSPILSLSSSPFLWVPFIIIIIIDRPPPSSQHHHKGSSPQPECIFVDTSSEPSKARGARAVPSPPAQGLPLLGFGLLDETVSGLLLGTPLRGRLVRQRHIAGKQEGIRTQHQHIFAPTPSSTPKCGKVQTPSSKSNQSCRSAESAACKWTTGCADKQKSIFFHFIFKCVGGSRPR